MGIGHVGLFKAIKMPMGILLSVNRTLNTALPIAMLPKNSKSISSSSYAIKSPSEIILYHTIFRLCSPTLYAGLTPSNKVSSFRSLRFDFHSRGRGSDILQPRSSISSRRIADLRSASSVSVAQMTKVVR
jgi:hypothetical protein